MSTTGGRKGRRGRWAIVGGLLLAVALLAVPGLPGASAQAAATAGPAPGAPWAYGVSENVSLTVSTNATTYSVAGYFAYHVILSEKNTSNSTFQLELQRTEGFAFTATYCRPSCTTTAVEAIVIHDRAWESEVGFANLTRNGSVMVNGSAVPALALVNTSTRTDSNVTETANYTLHTALRNLRGTDSVEFAGSSTSTVAFSPALGLVPETLSPGLMWNATSTLSAQGSASGSITHNRTSTPGGSLSGRTTWNPSISETGVVRVIGRDLGRIVLRGGVSAPVLALSVVGPFVAGEGILFVPSAADLFGSGAAAYSGVAAGTSTASTLTMDWNQGGVGADGLLATSAAFVPAPNGASLVGGDPATLAGSPPVTALAAASSGGAVVQAEPESVAQASSGSACILAGSCSPQPNPSLAAPSASGPAAALVRAAVAGAVIVGLAGLLAGLVVVRRRRVPPPPAEAPAFAPPVGTPSTHEPERLVAPGTGPTAPSPEEDPLGPVW